MVLSDVFLILNGVVKGVTFRVCRCCDIVGDGGGGMSDVCWSCGVDWFFCIRLIEGVKHQTIIRSQRDIPIRQMNWYMIRRITIVIHIMSTISL